MNPNDQYHDLIQNGSYTTKAGDITPEDVAEVIGMLNRTVRSRHACISKGQLHEAIEGLVAHNVVLERQNRELQNRIAGLSAELLQIKTLAGTITVTNSADDPISDQARELVEMIRSGGVLAKPGLR